MPEGFQFKGVEELRANLREISRAPFLQREIRHRPHVIRHQVGGRVDVNGCFVRRETCIEEWMKE
ncbi:MAG: hypothetical protein V3S91_05570, partial [Gemmatimonadota bacterium]